VQEYITKFEQAAHNLLLYNPNYDETYFVTRFLTGLKEDIRSGIVQHRPLDVDTASALALLQEAKLGWYKAKPQFKDTFRAAFKTMNDKEKVTEVDKLKQQPLLTESKDKLAALKNFRKKNGFASNVGTSGAKTTSVPLRLLFMSLRSY